MNYDEYNDVVVATPKTQKYIDVYSKHREVRKRLREFETYVFSVHAETYERMATHTHTMPRLLVQNPNGPLLR